LSIGPWQSLVGGIVGTGMNFGFFLNEHEAVNLESAGFDKFPQTKEGKWIDKHSHQPGIAMFEKETAGKYLYQHFNLMKKELGIKYKDLESTFEMNELLKKNVPKATPLVKKLFERSAKLVATQIAGTLMYKERDMTFVMEGSLFYKAKNYKALVKQTVQDITKKYSPTFVRVEDSGVIGAAKLVA
jgi:hexokinase